MLNLFQQVGMNSMALCYFLIFSHLCFILKKIAFKEISQ
jgi:hypothetical protein